MVSTETRHDGYEAVTPARPCNLCGGTSWCSRSSAGNVSFCRRPGNVAALPASAFARTDRNGSEYILHFADEADASSCRRAFTQARPIARRLEAEELDRAYTALLGALHLGLAHRWNLTQRGLSAAEIASRGYRTLPASYDRVHLAEVIRTAVGAKSEGVPGFCWSYGERVFRSSPGLLVPVRNLDRQIVALKIRRDDPTDGAKYRSVSSRSSGGASPGAPVHVPLFDGSRDTVYITEGEIKADVATALSGTLTLSVPGVSSWRPVLDTLHRIGPKRAYVAFDSDWKTNTNVEHGLLQLRDALHAEGFKTGIVTWPTSVDPQAPQQTHSSNLGA